MSGHGTLRRWRAPLSVIGLVGFLWMPAPAPALPDGLPSVSQTDFPNDDAVVLRLHQSWTLGAGGGQVYEEHRFVKLFNDRAWDRYADPRVDYLDGAEAVELVTARTHLPDGSTMGLPDYSTTVLSPFGYSKWPALARWRQMLYIFSGVQNNAVLELHYKRTSQPGTRRWLSAELRIGDLDPVIERIVEVTVPGSGDGLRHACTPEGLAELTTAAGKGQATTYRWTMKNVAADPDEPGCPPWRQRCGRLRFTNCPSAEAWTADLLRAVDSAVEPNDAIGQFVKDCTKDAVDDADKVRAIAKKLAASFNFVDEPNAWVGRRVRSSDEVFDSCYGSRLESAAVMLAALRSAGLPADPWLAVERDTFSATAPTDDDLAAVLIKVDAAGQTWWLEPAGGIINPNGAWRDRDVLSVANGRFEQFSAFVSDSSQPDTVRIRGALKLDDKAEKLTGQFSLELSGLFVEAETLRDDKQRESRISALVNQVVSDLKVVDSSVSHLSQDRLVASATVESDKAPADVYGRRLVILAAHSPALAEAHLPVDRSVRRTPVRLLGPLVEDVQVTIELPEGWSPAVLPEPLQGVQGDWGRMSQTVELADRTIKIARRVGFDVQVIPPADFAAVREAARALASEACRALLLEPKKP